MSRTVWLSAASLLILLAGCGGGGGGNDPPITVTPAPSPAPTPTPTPSPTPSPTPTPTPGASTFPVSTAQESVFIASYAFASYNSEAISAPPTATAVGLGGAELRILPGVNGPSRVVVTQGPAPSDTGFFITGRSGDELIGNNAGEAVLANIFSPGVTDPAVAFRYLSYALVTTIESFRTSIGVYLFGSNSRLATLPVSGTRSLAGRVRGRQFSVNIGASPDIVDLAGSANVTVNFETRQVRVQLTLSDAALSFDNSYTLTSGPSGDSRFEGDLVATGGTTLGRVTGATYGPEGDEVGLTFAVSRVVGGSQQQRIVGVVVAK